MKYHGNCLKIIFVFCLLLLTLPSDVKADQLSDVSFPADSSRILSRYKNKIIVWETRTGKLLRTFETETSAFKYAAFLPDGKTVFSVNDKAEMIWLDIETGGSKNKTPGKAVFPYTISADGKTIAHSLILKSNNEEIIEFYDAVNGAVKGSFRYPSSVYVCLVFSTDDEKLLAVGDDNLSVISLKTGKIEKSFAHQMPFLHCAASTRGDSVLVASPIGSGENSLQIYSLRNNQKYLGLDKEYSGQISDIGAVGYSTNNPDLAFAAGKNRQTGSKSVRGLFILWNTTSGKIKQSITTVTPLASAALSADGKSVLVQEVKGIMTLFDLETGAVIRKYSEVLILS